MLIKGSCKFRSGKVCPVKSVKTWLLMLWHKAFCSASISHEESIKDQSGFFAATANAAAIPKTVAGMVAAQLSFPKDKKLL